MNSLDEIPFVRRTTTEDVLQSLRTPIAVVGNGPIRQLYGERIDDHATVIRFNSFRLSGFEPHVGRRVTHWCIGGRPDLSLRRPGIHRLLETFRLRRSRGVVPNSSIGPSTTIFTTNSFSMGLMDDWMQYMKIEPACVGDATLLHPLQSVIPFPSTGFVALYLLLLFQPRVSVFGFAGLVDGHYWNSRDQHFSRHLPTAAQELAMIRGDRRIELFE